MNIFNLKKKKVFGFTLIELMVVIGIISLLVAVVTSSYSSARKKARVVKRVSDLKQVQAALEFYYAVNRSYPSNGGTWVCPNSTASVNSLIPGLAPTYIAAIPTDPQWSASDQTANCYFYRSDGVDYGFVDYNVTEMVTGQSAPNYATYPDLIDPARDGGSSLTTVEPWGTLTGWKVYSAGGAAW